MGEPLLRTAWRRKFLILAVIVACALAAAGISSIVSPVYQATSRLIIVVQSEGAPDFGAIQAAQVTARSYSELVTSPNIANRVEQRLGTDGLPGSVRVQPVPETQLIAIQAEAASAQQAKDLADAYAREVVEYAALTLQPTTGARLTVADLAPLPRAAAQPKPRLYVMLAILLGVPLGFGAALLRDRLDARMREPYEIEERFDVPVLGRIPRRGRSEESRAAFAEAFRILRVSFGHVSPPDRDGTVAITSASAGEGKSTITHGLALAASEAGQSVLVIEADVHRMSQRRLFRVDIAPNAPGFVDALVGEAALEDVIYPTPVPGVKLIPAGLRQMSLSSTLEGSRAAETLGALSGLADLVLLDCPPLTAGADASVLASGASAVILVMRLRQTSRPEIIQALRRLERVDARVIGSVVNADRTLPIDPYGYAEDQLGGQSPKRRADARRKSTASLLEEFGG